jgi:hypothetical protein
MTREEEQAYLLGAERANLSLLQYALSKIECSRTRAQLISEREDVVMTLKSLCKDFGDTDWDGDLHLADVIQKHLAASLRQL